MLIKSLDEMEAIVQNSDNLSWDGWTVIETDTNKNGMMSSNGAFVGGKWVMQKRYEPTTSGWEIPNKFMR